MTDDAADRSAAGGDGNDRGATGSGDPDDDEVVQTAADAAEGIVFKHYDQSTVTDLDVTVTFEAGVLDVDVYLNAPADAGPDPDAVTQEAVETAGDAVDELFDAPTADD